MTGASGGVGSARCNWQSDAARGNGPDIAVKVICERLGADRVAARRDLARHGKRRPRCRQCIGDGFPTMLKLLRRGGATPRQVPSPGRSSISTWDMYLKDISLIGTTMGRAGIPGLIRYMKLAKIGPLLLRPGLLVSCRRAGGLRKKDFVGNFVLIPYDVAG